MAGGSRERQREPWRRGHRDGRRGDERQRRPARGAHRARPGHGSSTASAGRQAPERPVRASGQAWRALRGTGGSNAAEGPSCTGGLDCGGVSCCQNIVVPAGTFPMGRSASGSDAFAGSNDEQPEHTVIVASFALDTFEVTVGRFRKFADAFDGTPPAAGAGHTRSSPTAAGKPTGTPVCQTPKRPSSRISKCDPTTRPGRTRRVAHEKMAINCVSWFDAAAVLRVGRRSPPHRSGVGVRGGRRAARTGSIPGDAGDPAVTTDARELRGQRRQRARRRGKSSHGSWEMGAPRSGRWDVRVEPGLVWRRLVRRRRSIVQQLRGHQREHLSRAPRRLVADRPELPSRRRPGRRRPRSTAQQRLPLRARSANDSPEGNQPRSRSRPAGPDCASLQSSASRETRRASCAHACRPPSKSIAENGAVAVSARAIVARRGPRRRCDPPVARLGTELDHPIGAGDDRGVMLDDDQRVAALDEAIEDADELARRRRGAGPSSARRARRASGSWRACRR